MDGFIFIRSIFARGGRGRRCVERGWGGEWEQYRRRSGRAVHFVSEQSGSIRFGLIRRRREAVGGYDSASDPCTGGDWTRHGASDRYGRSAGSCGEGWRSKGAFRRPVCDRHGAGNGGFAGRAASGRGGGGGRCRAGGPDRETGRSERGGGCRQGCGSRENDRNRRSSKNRSYTRNSDQECRRYSKSITPVCNKPQRSCFLVRSWPRRRGNSVRLSCSAGRNHSRNVAQFEEHSNAGLGCF